MIWWWTCPPPQGCFDRIQPGPDRERVARDRDAHLAAQHPGWQPTGRQLTLIHWP